MTTTLTYTTQLKFAQAMGLAVTAPAIDNATATTGVSRETVGTGDGSNTIFYLDHKNIIDSSYTLYYGATAAAAVALTETTHYTLDKDTGIITLTTTGKTLISTNSVYANYKYFNTEYDGFNSHCTRVLQSAQREIETKTGTVFVDGSGATPSYATITTEYHEGQGRFKTKHFTYNYPIADITTQLNGAITASDTTITVDSTNGFASSGTIVIGTEQITYTGKTTTDFTGCTRGANGTTATIGADNSFVTNFVIESSLTEEGTEPTWSTLQYKVDYELEPYSGMVMLTESYINQYYNRATLIGNINPVYGLPNRVRFSYSYAWRAYDDVVALIPDDIERLTHMIAAKELKHMLVNFNIFSGRNEFKSSMIDIDEAWITDTIMKYSSSMSSNI